MVAKVEIYSSRICPYCGWAKRLLDKKGVAYTEVLIDRDDEARMRMREKTHSTSVPQIFINDTPIGGYEDMVELDQEGELDAMLAVPASS